MTPSPVQVDAMREWLRRNTTTPAQIESYLDHGIEWLIDVHYPGGVVQFLADDPDRSS